MNELRTLLPFLRPYRRGMAVGLVFVVLSNILGIPVLDLLGRAIDALNRGDGMGAVRKYAALVVGLAILSGFCRYLMRELLNGISRRVENDLRNAFFDKLMLLDATFYGGTRT